MKQFGLFGSEGTGDEKYTTKIQSPIYEPKGTKPHILELLDMTKTKRLFARIKESNIDPVEKKFLYEAARRHSVFHYDRIAEYYAHSNKEMQDLMEQSALIIIDFDKAIQHGFVKLSEDVAQQYLTETK